MQTITKEQLAFLLEERHESITLQTKGGTELSVSPNLFIDFNEESANYNYHGYTVEMGEKLGKSKTFSTLLSRLKKNDAEIENNYLLLSINDRFSCLEDYENDFAFQNISMQDLLAHYERKADSFELVCGCYEPFYLPLSEGEKALASLDKQHVDKEKAYYEKVKDEFHLPSYEEFVASLHTILEQFPDESDAFDALFEKWEEHNDRHTSFLYHALAERRMQGERKELIEQFAKSKRIKPLDDELNKKKLFRPKALPYFDSAKLCFALHGKRWIAKDFPFPLNGRNQIVAKAI